MLETSMHTHKHTHTHTHIYMYIYHQPKEGFWYHYFSLKQENMTSLFRDIYILSELGLHVWQ